MRYAAVSAIECSSSVNGNGANEDPEGRERGKEKVAASLVRSLVANLFAPPFPDCFLSLSRFGHARKATVSLADCERRSNSERIAGGSSGLCIYIWNYLGLIQHK